MQSRGTEASEAEVTPAALWEELWKLVPGSQGMRQFTADFIPAQGWIGAKFVVEFNLGEGGNPIARVRSFEGPGGKIELQDVSFSTPKDIQDFFADRDVVLSFNN